jgi:DNA primase
VQTLSEEQRKYFEQAASIYQQDLAGDTSAQAYLAKRGLGPAALGTFRLGVVHRPLVGHEGYAGRLAIPYLTPAGVVNLRFRCLQSHDCGETVLWTDKNGKPHTCTKYLSIDGAGTNLYNVLDLKKDSPSIVVAEGEIDAMSWSLAGVPAVGLPGVDAWQEHFGRCLEDFDVIYAAGDSDTAGRKLNSLLAKKTKARPLRFPPGEDSNSIYAREGADGLRRLIE